MNYEKIERKKNEASNELGKLEIDQLQILFEKRLKENSMLKKKSQRIYKMKIGLKRQLGVISSDIENLKKQYFQNKKRNEVIGLNTNRIDINILDIEGKIEESMSDVTFLRRNCHSFLNSPIKDRRKSSRRNKEDERNSKELDKRNDEINRVLSLTETYPQKCVNEWQMNELSWWLMDTGLFSICHGLFQSKNIQSVHDLIACKRFVREEMNTRLGLNIDFLVLWRNIQFLEKCIYHNEEYIRDYPIIMGKLSAFSDFLAIVESDFSSDLVFEDLERLIFYLGKNENLSKTIRRRIITSTKRRISEEEEEEEDEFPSTRNNSRLINMDEYLDIKIVILDESYQKKSVKEIFNAGTVMTSLWEYLPQSHNENERYTLGIQIGNYWMFSFEYNCELVVPTLCSSSLEEEDDDDEEEDFNESQHHNKYILHVGRLKKSEVLSSLDGICTIIRNFNQTIYSNELRNCFHFVELVSTCLGIDIWENCNVSGVPKKWKKIFRRVMKNGYLMTKKKAVLQREEEEEEDDVMTRFK